MPKLIDIIANLDLMNREDVILAKPEWNAASEAGVFPLTSEGTIPEKAAREGFKYFLEVDVARQVLDEFLQRADTTLEEKCHRLIRYARYDA